MNKFFEEGAEGGGGSTAATTLLQGGGSTTEPAKSADGTDTAQTGAAMQEPFWKGLLNDDGTVNKARWDHLPDDLKPLRPTLDKLNSLPDILKTYHHANTLVGKKGLMPLREGATKAEVEEFTARMREINRVPEKPEGYGITRPEDIPEELWNDEYANGMAALLHKHNISPEAVKELVAANYEATKQTLAQQEVAQAKQREQFVAEVNKTVQKEWGNNLQERLSAAQRGARFLGIDPTSEVFTDHPEVAFACARAYDQIKEAKLVDGDSSGGGGRSAQDEMNAMLSDPAHKFYNALRDQMSPQFNEAVRYRNQLSEKIVQERMGKRR